MFFVGLIIGGLLGFAVAIFFIGSHDDDDHYRAA